MATKLGIGDVEAYVYFDLREFDPEEWKWSIIGQSKSVTHVIEYTNSAMYSSEPRYHESSLSHPDAKIVFMATLHGCKNVGQPIGSHVLMADDKVYYRQSRRKAGLRKSSGSLKIVRNGRLHHFLLQATNRHDDLIKVFKDKIENGARLALKRSLGLI